jgi:D-arabinose 1-dehydrogenase-like Zn-dependent alcohol dehydrogenase
MKALVLIEYMTFEWQDVPEPVAGSDDVMIEVKACGICGSDVHGGWSVVIMTQPKTKRRENAWQRSYSQIRFVSG